MSIEEQVSDFLNKLECFVDEYPICQIKRAFAVARSEYVILYIREEEHFKTRFFPEGTRKYLVESREFMQKYRHIDIVYCYKDCVIILDPMEMHTISMADIARRLQAHDE
jgi:hypothetical protein